MNYVHILRRPDGGVIKIESRGEIVIITTNERVMLKEEDKELGHDINYFKELFISPEERQHGVYTIQCEKGLLTTIDDEKNEFYIYANGQTEEKMTPLPEPIVEVVEEVKEEEKQEEQVPLGREQPNANKIPNKDKSSIKGQKQAEKEPAVLEPNPEEIPEPEPPKLIPLPKYLYTL